VYEDICNFTCDTGYQLTNDSSQTKTCLSGGMWSGTEAKCVRG